MGQFSFRVIRRGRTLGIWKNVHFFNLTFICKRFNLRQFCRTIFTTRLFFYELQYCRGQKDKTMWHKNQSKINVSQIPRHSCKDKVHEHTVNSGWWILQGRPQNQSHCLWSTKKTCLTLLYCLHRYDGRWCYPTCNEGNAIMKNYVYLTKYLTKFVWIQNIFKRLK